MFLDGRSDVGACLECGVGCSLGWCRGMVLYFGILVPSGDAASIKEWGSEIERKGIGKLDNSRCLLFPSIQPVHIYVYLSKRK